MRTAHKVVSYYHIVKLISCYIPLLASLRLSFVFSSMTIQVPSGHIQLTWNSSFAQDITLPLLNSQFCVLILSFNLRKFSWRYFPSTPNKIKHIFYFDLTDFLCISVLVFIMHRNNFVTTTFFYVFILHERLN